MTTSVRPEPAPPRPYQFPRFERRMLGNGVTLIVAPMRELPIVTIAIVTDAGAMSEPSGLDGVASLTARALLEGTAQRSAAELTDRLEHLGASVSADADWDMAGVHVSVLRHRLGDAMALLAEIVTRPAFPHREVERLKAERLSDILQLRAEPRGLADETFTGALYASTARYAHPERGTAASVERLLRDDIVQFHAARYRATGSTLILTGDVSADEAQAIAERTFGAWTGAAAEPPYAADVTARTARAVHLVDRPDAPQSEIRIGHVGLPRLHPEYFHALLMNALLGGLFSSRINLNLREKHAYTYGAHSGFDWRRGAGPFVVSTAVERDVTALAAAEILKEIDAIRSELVRADELELAASYLAGVFPIRYETTDAVARALVAMVVYGLPADYFDRYRDLVRAVTREDVLAAARQHLHPDALQLVIVGADAAVRAPLEAMQFGPLIAYDKDGKHRS